MKWVLALLLSFAFLSPVMGGDICHYVFRKNTGKIYGPDLEKIDRINRLEEWSGSLRARAYKENPLTPTAARKARIKFERVEEKFLVGESAEALTAYRTLFRQVEGSALTIERYSKLAEAMRKAQESGVRNYGEYFRQEGVIKSLSDTYSAKINTVDELAEQLNKVEKILRKRHRQLGAKFDEYNYTRLALEKLAKAEHCSGACQVALKEFHKNVGLSSPGERELFKAIIGNHKNYGLNKVRSVFNAHPESILVARKREFLREGFALLKSYAGNLRLMRRLFAALSETKLGKHRRLIRFFKSIYDKRFLDQDQIIAKRIAHSDKSVAEKMKMMDDMTQEADRDLFWLNFSRSVEGQVKRTWNELLDHAKKTSNSVYERMARAAEIGAKLGPIGQKKLKGVKRIVAAVVVGGAGFAYVNFNVEDDLIDSTGDDPVNDSLEAPPHQLDHDEPQVLIDYLSQEDEEITDTLGVLYQLHRTSEKGAAPGRLP